MNKLFVVPIEPLEERYSSQWRVWIDEELQLLGVKDFQFIDGKELTTTIESGQFLDVFGTNYYKASQIQILMQKLRDGEIRHGDSILFLDGWFPGIESLFYVRDGAKIDFKVYGCMHAGTWDTHDFLSRSGMTRWAEGIERSWLNEMDGIFVATHFHKDLIQGMRNTPPEKIHVTGFPMHRGHIASKPWSQKENIVVFPHRIAPEKQPHIFSIMASELSKKYPDWKFIKTKDHCATKADYYDLLSRSKIAVSYALQETWGIAQQEALFAGCLPLVPDRLSYSEMYLQVFKYSDDSEAIQRLNYWIEALNQPEFEIEMLTSRNVCSNILHEKNSASIRNMLEIINR